MGKKKEPKFKQGDTVVIMMYGTVGKITDVKFIDGTYVYEVNHSEGLYLESTLQYVEEYEGEIHADGEKIDIEYKFIFGDLVQVEGYEFDYFKVIGFRTEIWRYKENAWEDIIYELSRISDDEWLEAHEEEISLIADAEQADTLIQQLGLLPAAAKKKLRLETLKKSKAIPLKGDVLPSDEKKDVIDGLLDVYNDYQALYKWFGNEEYYHVMKIILMKIKKTMEESHSASEN